MDPDALSAMSGVMDLWAHVGMHHAKADRALLGFVQMKTDAAPRAPSYPTRLEPQSDAWIVADARLDNRGELCEQLGLEAGRRDTLTNETLILMAYQKWGTACADRLLGAFAFIICDTVRGRIFCCRDHMGFRPFFYHNGPDAFVFASDLEAVLACPLVPKRRNMPLVAAFLQEDTYYAEKRQTFWQDIVKIPPAHHVTVQGSTEALVRHWSLDDVAPVRMARHADYVDALSDILGNAVACRLSDALPMGCHISGGLDSSVVAGIATGILAPQGRSLAGYSWSPDPKTLRGTEHELIDLLCNHLSIKCNYIDLTPEHFAACYSKDFTRVPQEMMLRESLVQDQAIADGTQVILSGWGGDECITGHGWGLEAELLLSGKLPTLWSEFMASKRASAARFPRTWYQILGRLWRTISLPMLPDGAARWIMGTTLSKNAMCFLQPDIIQRYAADMEAMRGRTLRPRPGVQRNQWTWLDNGHLTRRIEAWAINGARRGVDYRYPLLDRRVLEFGLGLPGTQFIRNGKKRAIMRDVARQVTPPELVTRISKIETAAFETIEHAYDAGAKQMVATFLGKNDLENIHEVIDLEAVEAAARTESLDPRSADSIAITIATALTLC
ncbi:asparagine synthase-related protein [Gymnodinialimonas sp.]